MVKTGFDLKIGEAGYETLRAEGVTTLQVNVGKYCNQTCRHCHVDAGPHRQEIMSVSTAEKVVSILRRYPEIETLDITGGAPELHAPFRYLVREARSLNRHVIDRSNLTVLFVAGQDDLAEFLANQRVRIIASLPCYLESNVDKQRGRGVYQQSIEAIRILNGLDYGGESSGLELDLVYNPIGPTLPPDQASLEADYKRELNSRFGIQFNRLFTLANMPIARFKSDLVQSGSMDAYMSKLVTNFNPASVDSLMCRSLISISWDGRVFDCDFNQMLELPVTLEGVSHVDNFDLNALKNRRIRTAEHCFGCTAGAGSSCTGALTARK
jgi:radical SAM/Cys-rich protein